MSTTTVDLAKSKSSKNSTVASGSHHRSRGSKRQLSSRRSKRTSHLSTLSSASGSAQPQFSSSMLTFKGQHDSYRVINDVDRKMAKEVFEQTQFEVPIPLGRECERNYVIGSGGFGDVCLGVAINSSRYVGIKIPKESSTPDNIKKELTLYQEIADKGFRHILPIMDSFEVPDNQGIKLYQVMTLAGLGNVEQLKKQLHLIRDKQFKEQILFCLAEGLLGGLAEMHSAGFYHLDMKPANLVIKGEGDVFLIDFGSSAQTKDGIIQEAESGDVDYYSKERWLGTACGIEFAGAPADAWAAGITLLCLWDNQYSHQALETLGDELIDEVEAAEQQGQLLDSKNVSERFEQAAIPLHSYLKNAAPQSIESFIRDLLHPDVSKRLTPEAALTQPDSWFQKMKSSASSWRKSVKEYLREFIQAEQRVLRSLSPEDLPFGHFASFVSRPKLEATLRERLLKTSVEETTITVCQGMGGVGKTQLVNYLVYSKDIQAQFGTKLWFRNADSESLLEAQCLGLAQEWGLVGDKPTIPEVLTKVHHHLISNAKQSGKPWLMVFDNAETFEILAPFLPEEGGHVIITTRNPNWENAIVVDVMTESEGQKLVNTLLQKEEPQALNLCKTLGFLPLAIVQACAYIKVENLNIVDYIQKLEKSSKELLERDERSFGKKLPASILGMWQMVFQTLIEKHPKAFSLLEVLAVLSPDAIPQGVIEQLGTEESQGILQRYALLQMTQGLGSIHRLLQLAVRSDARRPFPEIISQGMKVLHQVYNFHPSNLALIQTNRLLLPHGETLCQHYTTLPTPTPSQEDYYHTLHWLGNLQGVLANFSKQRTLLEKSLALAENLYGKEHPTVATSLNNLGVAFKDLGDAKKAIEFYERSLAIKEKVHGKEHPDVATSLNNLGVAFDDLGETKKAIEVYERSLAIKEKVYGKEHPDVATSLNNLGAVFDTLGDVKKAIEVYERSLAIREKVYGKEHPTVAESLNNIGGAFDDLGDIKKAIEFFERSLAIKEKVHGKEHPDVALSLNNLGEAFRVLGDTKKAIEFYERSLAIREKIYGKEHPDVARSLNNLGAVFRVLGDTKKAIEFFERSLAIYEKVYGKEHPDVATSLNNLGIAFDDLGDTKKAIEFYERSLAIREKVYGKEHPTVATSLNNLGEAFRVLGDIKKAIEFYERSLTIYEKVYGKEHPDVALSLNNLGVAFGTLGDTKKEIEFYERSLAIYEKVYGKEHPDVALSLSNLGIVFRDLGDTKKATEYLQQAQVIYEKFYGPEHQKVVEIKKVLKQLSKNDSASMSFTPLHDSVKLKQQEKMHTMEAAEAGNKGITP